MNINDSSGQLQRRFQANIDRRHQCRRHLADGSDDKFLIKRDQVLTLYGGRVEKLGGLAFRRGDIDEQLGWFDGGELGGARDHCDDYVFQSSVVLAALNNQCRAYFCAAQVGEWQIGQNNVAAF